MLSRSLRFPYTSLKDSPQCNTATNSRGLLMMTVPAKSRNAESDGKVCNRGFERESTASPAFQE